MKNICTILKRIAIAATVCVSLFTGENAQAIVLIDQDSVWDASNVPSGPIDDIYVTNGATFIIDDCTLDMDITSSIFVYQGSTLDINQALLYTSQNDYLWEGIILENGANIIMRNSQIERAKTGVKHTIGNCLIQIENSYFFNCAKGIELNGYPNNNNSYITNTFFEVAPLNTVLEFNLNSSLVLFNSHISAENSFVPLISGCVFLNSNSKIKDYKHAINVLNSKVTVTDYNGINSFFRGFEIAINSTDNYNNTLFVWKSDFERNVTGIKALSVGTTDISCCSFSLDDFDEINFPYREGIMLTTCKDYNIYWNDFYKLSGSNIINNTGVSIKNDSGLSGYVSSIFSNTMKGLMYGIHAEGNNLSNPFSGSTIGLEITCNDITNCIYGIYNNGLIGDPQGSPTNAAGNVFTNDSIDIYNVIPNTLRYFYDVALLSFHNVDTLFTPQNTCQPSSCYSGSSTNETRNDTFLEDDNTTTERNIETINDTSSFGPGDFPLTCYNKKVVVSEDWPFIYSDELKFVFLRNGNICDVSGDSVFVQGVYTPTPNEYPEYAPASWYSRSYDGVFVFEIHYSDSSMNTYDSHYGTEKCLTDKQCQEINLQITIDSYFAIGKHVPSRCAQIDNENAEDTLGAFAVRQLSELATPYHDFGDGTITITWTGFDGTPRQHVIYFMIDDHFYIDYVGYGVEENEAVYANGMRVFPNPTDGTFAIEAENITNVEIFDIAGQKVLTDRSGNRTINAGNLPTGVFFLKVETATETKYGKLMKK